MDRPIFGQVSDLSKKRPFPFSLPLFEPEKFKNVAGTSILSVSSRASSYGTAFSTNVNSPPHSNPSSQASEESEAARLLKYHKTLLRWENEHHEGGEITTTPIFTMPVLEHAKTLAGKGSREAFPQYGLIAGMTEDLRDEAVVKREDDEMQTTPPDPRIFFNIGAPSSTFICGSQGSGKSHTLSCLLENCLISSDANKLPKPLTGLVFHYNTLISDHGGSPCEAAYLASNSAVKVRVLCSPTNLRTIKASHILNPPFYSNWVIKANFYIRSVPTNF